VAQRSAQRRKSSGTLAMFAAIRCTYAGCTQGAAFK
jgi:hypothetical protein